MTLLQYYIRFLGEMLDGTRPLPEGMTLHETDEMRRAMELQAQIARLGIPAFVRMCAEESGIVIPEEEYASFDPAALAQALSRMPAPQEDAEPPQEDAEPVKTEIRDIYEVFLDSVCLDDALLQYLIDVLKRRDVEGFRTLSHAAARTILDMDDFLAWLGNKELLAPWRSAPASASLTAALRGCGRRGSLSCWRRCCPATARRSSASAATRRSFSTCPMQPMTGSVRIIWTAIIPRAFS